MFVRPSVRQRVRLRLGVLGMGCAEIEGVCVGGRGIANGVTGVGGVGDSEGGGGSGRVGAEWTHLERTAGLVRAEHLYTAHITCVKPLSPTVRLFTLVVTAPLHSQLLSHLSKDVTDTSTSAASEQSVQNPKPIPLLSFYPGQFLDLHLPNLPKPGGFTIVSVPSKLPELQLAVQKAEWNPAAKWLWDLLYDDDGMVEETNAEVKVRVGGEFRWPPPPQDGIGGVVEVKRIKHVVLVAGGLGVNPLISIFSHLHETHRIGTNKMKLTFIYACRLTYHATELADIIAQIPFLDEVLRIVESDSWPRLAQGGGSSGARYTSPYLDARIHFTLPSPSPSSPSPSSFTATSPALRITLYQKSQNVAPGVRLTFSFTRPTAQEVLDVLAMPGITEGDCAGEAGNSKRDGDMQTVVYVCGPRRMTDEFVDAVERESGGKGVRVLSERWW
ncbi:hypothetical protein BDZ91DRAFT_716576 [Kalaharituber pfeilii]|nr:hypothetical protein BDZ91DRAFT_716576 [Kalaharituber pfeilii]